MWEGGALFFGVLKGMLQQARLLQYSRESVHSSTLRIFVKMVRFALAYSGSLLVTAQSVRHESYW